MVRDHGPKDTGERFVLLMIADYTDNKGDAWPSIESLAEKTAMSVRGVQKIIRRLSEGGWIEIDEGGGRKKCNVYRIKTANMVHYYDGKTLNHVRKNPEPRSQNPEHSSPDLLRTSNELTRGSAPDGKNTENGSSSGSDDGPHSGAPRKPRSVPAKEAAACEAAQAFKVWNAMAARHGLPVAHKLTDTRKRSLQRRVKDAGGVEEFSKLVRTVPKSEFLLGSNDRAWKASLDFICQPSSFEKLRDGLYHQGKLPSPEREWTAEEIDAMRQRAESLKAHEVWND